MAVVRPVIENSVAPNAMPGNRLQPANFNGGEIIGDAVERLGRQGQQTAMVMREIEVDDARTRARDAFNRAQIAEQELLNGEQGFFNQRGINAVNSAQPARQQVDQLYQAQAVDLKDRLSQQMYSEMATRRRAALSETFGRHLSTERARYQEGVDREARNVELQGAVTAYNNPDEIERRLATIADITIAQGRRMGLGAVAEDGTPDATLRSLAQAEQGKAVVAIAARLATESPGSALDFVREMVGAGRIPQDAATRLIDELDNQAADENADTRIDDYVTYAGDPAPAEGAPSGLVAPATIDPRTRSPIRNADGSVSTISTISVGTDQGEVLIPTIINGRRVSEAEATAHYRRTGEHLGIFQSAEAATAYARQLSESQGRREAPPVRVPLVQGIYDPTHGAGRITATPEQHRARNGGTGRNAADIGAPVGTPIRPPTTGTVSDIGFEAGGAGHYIRVRHPNGYETTYMHLAQRPPLERGAQVGANTVIGQVGNTGRSSGPHVDFSVRRAGTTALVDPRSVNWTAGGASQIAGPQPGREVDVAATIRRIQSDPNLTAVEKQSLTQAAQRRQGLVMQQRAQTERQVRDRVDSYLDTLPANGLTSYEQIPLDVRSQIAEVPGLRARLVGEADANRRQIEAQQNAERGGGKSPEYEDLFRLSNGTDADRQQFARMNIDAIPNLSSSDRRSMIAEQGRIIRGEGRQQERLARPNYSSIYAEVGRIAPSNAGIGRGSNVTDTQRGNRQMLTRVVMEEVARRQQTRGERLEQTEIQDIIREYTQPVEIVTRNRVLPGTGSSPTPAYRAAQAREAAGERYVGTRVPGVPSDALSRINQTYRQRYGRNATTAEAIRLYGEMQR